MHGFLVTFYTQEQRTYHNIPLADWILKEAKEAGVQGATMTPGKIGFGHDGQVHSENMFDLEDRPVQVAMAVGEKTFTPLMDRIKSCGQHIFYTRAPIEFDFTTD